MPTAPDLDGLARQCLADPDDEGVRPRLAARPQQLGRKDDAARIGGPEGRIIARFAVAAGVDLLTVAGLMVGRFAWADLDPAAAAALAPPTLRREVAAQVIEAITGVQSAVMAGLRDVARVLGRERADDLRACADRLAEAHGAVGRLRAVVAPLYDMADAARD